MHKGEMWQIFGKNGEPIEGVGRSSQDGNPTEGDDIVGNVVVWLYRFDKEGELELLWQRRSMNIDRYGGYWDVSAGGHIDLGESFTEATIREAQEEIGAKIDREDLRFGFSINLNSWQFARVYFVDWTGKEDNFHFDDGEVSEVKWVKYRDLEEFWQKNAKPPLMRDKITYQNMQEWFKINGYI